jgi:hypothetical protein
MRYGFDLLTLQRNVNRLMDGFERVYTAHDNGTLLLANRARIALHGRSQVLPLAPLRSCSSIKASITSLKHPPGIVVKGCPLAHPPD